MFAKAQWAQASRAASSLSQMAARQAKGNNDLGQLVRERQDLALEWQARDKLLVGARSEPPDKRSAYSEQALATRVSSIETRINEIDHTLVKDFPNYAVLTDPEPLTITEVQKVLHADEAVVFLLHTSQWEPTPEETFIWVVTKDNVRWGAKRTRHEGFD
jgi:hypothetical protein